MRITLNPNEDHRYLTRIVTTTCDYCQVSQEWWEGRMCCECSQLLRFKGRRGPHPESFNDLHYRMPFFNRAIQLPLKEGTIIELIDGIKHYDHIIKGETSGMLGSVIYTEDKGNHHRNAMFLPINRKFLFPFTFKLHEIAIVTELDNRLNNHK